MSKFIKEITVGYLLPGAARPEYEKFSKETSDDENSVGYGVEKEIQMLRIYGGGRTMLIPLRFVVQLIMS